MPGSSGGPLLAEQNDKMVVVALNFAAIRCEEASQTLDDSDNEHPNLAIAVDSFLEAVSTICADETTLTMANAAQLARQQIAAQDYHAAYSTLTSLIASCPTNVWASLLRAHVANSLGRASDAARDVQQALTVEPTCLELLLERAYYCFAYGFYQECIAITDRIVNASGSNLAALKLQDAAYGRLQLAQAIPASLPVADLTATQ